MSGAARFVVRIAIGKAVDNRVALRPAPFQ
jgi:hypothetical protein